MATTALVTEAQLIDGGRDLLRALKKARISVTAAVWKHSALFQEWQLELVLPLVKRIGILNAHSRVRHVLDQASIDPEIKMSRLSLLQPESSYTKGLLVNLKGFDERRLHHCWIGSDDGYIEDGYVYFVK